MKCVLQLPATRQEITYLALGAGNPKLLSLPFTGFVCLAGTDLVPHSAELRDFSFGDLPPGAENRLMPCACSSALLSSAAHTLARLSTPHARALLDQGQALAAFTALSHPGAALHYKHASADGCLHTLRLCCTKFPTPSIKAVG